MANEMSPDSSTPNPPLTEDIPRTVDEMKQKIGELFHCMVGPPIAYFEIPLPYEPGGQRAARFRYSTLRFRVAGGKEKEEALVGAMLEAFVDARVQLRPMVCDTGYKPLLFWRSQPRIDFRLGRIWCRVVIPGADLSRWAVREESVARGL